MLLGSWPEKTTRGGRIVLDVMGLTGLLGLLWMFLNVSEFSNALYRGGFLLVSILSAMVILAQGIASFFFDACWN